MNRSLFCLALLAPLWTARAQTAPVPFSPFGAAPPAKANPDPAKSELPGVYYRLVAEVIVLPKADAFELTSRENGGSGLFRQAAELLSKGRGRIEYLASFVTRGGAQGHVQGVDEFSFGTEFEPAVPPVPTAFEFSDLGDTLEARLTPDADRQHVKAQLKLQRRKLCGFQDFSYPADGLPIAQPQFQGQELDGQTHLALGEERYLGTWNPPEARLGESPECWLTFARVDQLDVKPPENARSQATDGWTLECRIYSMDRAAAHVWLGDTTGKGGSPGLQEIRHAENARFERLLAAPVKPGLRSVFEQLLALPYPTDMELGEEDLPTTTRTERSVVTEVAASGGESEKDADAKPQRSSRVHETITHGIEPPFAPHLPGVFTKYDQRQLGMTLEIEAGDWRAGVLDTKIVLRDSEDRGPLQATGTAGSYPKKPVLQNRVLECEVPLMPNRSLFLGTFNEPGANGLNDRKDSGRVWLAFLQLVSNER